MAEPAWRELGRAGVYLLAYIALVVLASANAIFWACLWWSTPLREFPLNCIGYFAVPSAVAVPVTVGAAYHLGGQNERWGTRDGVIHEKWSQEIFSLWCEEPFPFLRSRLATTQCREGRGRYDVKYNM